MKGNEDVYHEDAVQFADFEWAFGLNRLSLDLIGVWPRENQEDDFLRNTRIPFMISWMMFGLFLPQIYALTKVYQHLPLVVDNLITSCAALVSSTKLFMIWRRRKVLQQVVSRTASDWSREKTKVERKTMLKQAARARLFTMSGYAVMFACVLGFTTLPMFGLSIRVINNITDGRRYFPLQSSYPYDAEKSPYFELTYLSQLIAGGFVGVSFSVPDNFFGALVFHACAQCEILERRLVQVMACGNKQTIKLRLRSLVKMHVKLIRFVNAVEISFNILILAHITCLSVIIGCMAYSFIRSVENDAENPPLIQVLTLAASLVNLMMHMFVYCIASEILVNNSSKFVEAIYQATFYLYSGAYAKDVTIIMIRSQSPLQLTAGKFFSLSLNTYLKFLKNTGAYISMLLAVSSQNN
ncbi:odorant receptor 47b-like [Phymastichus coffea]|uniref:odorant receptor 47b-like n=1 Tax=Phymastichus coffea TaxID=108790 RepID=UPI00273A776C|nr:odorant receptor 47b-like [Phymastichus coffea]